MKYCFVHIPKTAGRAFANIVCNHTGLALSPHTMMAHYYRDEIGDYEFYGGHTFYPMISKILPGDTKYLTMLRNPLNRAYSHWKFIMEGNVYQRYGLESPVTFNEFLRNKNTWCCTTNFMSRYLTNSYRPPGEDEQQWQYQNKIETINMDVDQVALGNKALEVLAGFSFVGTQEKFRESVITACMALGFSPPMDVHVVETEYRHEMSDDDVMILISRNIADFMVYNEYK